MTLPVILLVGGRSTEHDASLHGYDRLLADIQCVPDRLALAGVVYVDRLGRCRIHPWPFLPVGEAALSTGPELSVHEGIAWLAAQDAFVFSLLHGNEGEDGAWQGVAEVTGLRGSFGAVLPSALGMDKRLQGIVAEALVPGLRTPRTWHLPSDATPATRRSWTDRVARELDGRPAVVKPNRMGASLLTTRVAVPTGAALREAVERVLPYDGQVLVQEYLSGREFTCGVVRRHGRTTALPVVEARTADGFLGHREKHEGDFVDAVLHTSDTDLTLRVQAASTRLFDEMSAFGFARLDFLAVDDRLYFLEINTLPGLMHGSAFPMMLGAAGLRLADLVEFSAAEHARTPARLKRLPYRIEHGEQAHV